MSLELAQGQVAARRSQPIRHQVDGVWCVISLIAFWVCLHLTCLFLRCCLFCSLVCVVCCSVGCLFVLLAWELSGDGPALALNRTDDKSQHNRETSGRQGWNGSCVGESLDFLKPLAGSRSACSEQNITSASKSDLETPSGALRRED